MTTPSTDTHSSMVACPPLEDIAAFLDGKLSPEERARITEHLARCESCYEIFAGAAHFLEEEGNSSADGIAGGDVIPFPLAEEKNQEKHVRVEPAGPTRRVSRWLPLAASVVLATGIGYMLWQSSRTLPEITVASVTEPLQKQDQLVGQRYQPKNIERSGEEAVALSSQAPAFLTGVYLVDLRLSTQAGDVKTTQDILYALQGELSQVLLMQTEANDWKEEADLMTDSAALDRFARSLPQRESALQLPEEPFLRFGLWAEAGRLSSVARSPEFFKDRENRRFLAAIPREVASLQDDRYAPIQESLRQIEELWNRRPEDYAALARPFEDIIDRIEEIKKQDQEELEPLPGE